MKKSGVALVFVLLSLVLVSSFVSAAGVGDALKPVSEGVIDVGNFMVNLLNPVLKYVLGDSTGINLGEGVNAEASGIFLARLMILIIVFSIAYIAADKTDFFTGSTSWAKWVVASAVGILGVRFISPGFIWNIVLPNAAFAIAVTVLLPFVLFYFIVRNWKSLTLQRVAWVVFGVAMLFFWAIMVSGSGLMGSVSSTYKSFYPVAALAALVMALWSGALHRMRIRMQEESAHLGSKVSQAALVRDRLKVAREEFAKDPTGYSPRTASGAGKKGKDAFNADKKEYQDSIDTIMSS
jgi:hypothetical protein